LEEKTKKKSHRKIVTVDSILTQDNVKDLIQRLIQKQAEIVDMVCIYHDREGSLNWSVTKELSLDLSISMIEQVKFYLLAQDNGEEETE
jgi:hypothetical protein